MPISVLDLLRARTKKKAQEVALRAVRPTVGASPEEPQKGTKEGSEDTFRESRGVASSPTRPVLPPHTSLPLSAPTSLNTEDANNTVPDPSGNGDTNNTRKVAVGGEDNIQPVWGPEDLSVHPTGHIRRSLGAQGRLRHTKLDLVAPKKLNVLGLDKETGYFLALPENIWDPGHIWSQQKGESHQQHTAFLIYLTLGPFTRSLMQAYKQHDPGWDRDTAPSAWYQWAQKWDWKGRAEAFDLYAVRAHLSRRYMRFEQQRDRIADKLEDLVDLTFRIAGVGELDGDMTEAEAIDALSKSNFQSAPQRMQIALTAIRELFDRVGFSLARRPGGSDPIAPTSVVVQTNVNASASADSQPTPDASTPARVILADPIARSMLAALSERMQQVAPIDLGIAPPTTIDVPDTDDSSDP